MVRKIDFEIHDDFPEGIGVLEAEIALLAPRLLRDLMLRPGDGEDGDEDEGGALHQGQYR